MGLLSALLTAFQALTRIPVPSLRKAPDPATIARSAVFYPLVGAVIGLAGWGFHSLLDDYVPRAILMLGVLVLWAFLTGGLHEDGLADTFDGIGGRTTRDEILTVMKDSRIGTYGTLALVFVSLIRWQSLTLMPAAETAFALVMSQVFPRAGAVVLAWRAGPATPGSGGALAESLRGSHVALTVVLAALLGIPWLGWQTAAAAGLCLLVVLALGVYFRRKIGGVTGDCLGTAVLLQEVAILLLIVMAPRLGA